MSSVTNYGSAAYGNTISTGITLTTGASPEPVKTPKGLIATRAVETKEGWVGQIIVAEQIIWESKPWTNSAEAAEREATQRVVNKVVKMLGGDK